MLNDVNTGVVDDLALTDARPSTGKQNADH